MVLDQSGLKVIQVGIYGLIEACSKGDDLYLAKQKAKQVTRHKFITETRIG